MTKLSTRILSLLLAVLMVVSMVTVFTLPAFAAEEEEETEEKVMTKEELDAYYEGLFENAFLINPNWKSAELKDDNPLEFVYRGKKRQVVCDTRYHFNNWAAAEASAYSKEFLNVSNIYDYVPVFIFAAGTYTEQIHFPTSAIILGANAGISPNAPVEDGDWTAENIGKNKGWKANSERKYNHLEDPTKPESAENPMVIEETIFKNGFTQETRVPSAGGDGQPFTGTEEQRFAFWLEQAKQMGKDPTLTVVIDGVTSLSSGLFINHYDYHAGSSSTPTHNLKYGNSTLANTSRRKINITYNNTIIDGGYVVFCSNGAHNIPEVTVKNSEIRNTDYDLIKRDIKSATFKNVYFHHLKGEASLWNVSNLVNTNLYGANGASARYAADFGYKVDTVVEDCVFYELGATNPNALLVGAYLRLDAYGNNPAIVSVSTTFTHTFDNNIFYDAACGQDDYIINAYDTDKSSNVTVNITNNQFHQSEGKNVYTPVDFTANHKKTNDIIVYENNTVTGAILNKDMVEPIDFNKALRDGITVNGVTFTKENTAVFAPQPILPKGEAYLFYVYNEMSYFISVFGGVKYKFNIDNINVFPLMTETKDEIVYTVFDAAKEKFEGKNIVLLPGDYGDNVDFTFPATFYGADFGKNPNDTTTATAENNYDWGLNKEYGKYGHTTLKTMRVGNDFAGTLTIDGIRQTGQFLDDCRNKANIEGKDKDGNTVVITENYDLDIVLKNILVDMPLGAPGEDGTVAMPASDNNKLYNLSNSRAKNGSGGTMVNDDAAKAFGKVYNDSFTLENVRLASCYDNSTVLDDYVPAHVTINGLYVDGKASYKARPRLSDFKLGQNVMNGTLTIINSNIRNIKTVGAEPIIDLGPYADKITKQITDHKYKATIKNNVFYNPAEGSGRVIRVIPYLISGLNICANKFINANGSTGVVVYPYKTNSIKVDTCILKDDLNVSCNIFTGYAEDKIFGDFKLGEFNPVNKDHDWSGTPTPNGDATCLSVGNATLKCTKCDEPKTVAGTAYADHVWNDGVYNNDATCQADGTKTQTCTVCKTETQVVTAAGTKVAHQYKEDAYKANNDATCITAGTETAKCTWCDATNKRTNEVKYPATGKHVFGEYVYDKNATYRADGTKTAKCTTSGCTATDTVAAPGTKLPAPAPQDSTKKFTDVKAGKWYIAAIDHAVAYGLVSGVDETTFGVNVTINRGMFVTILARVAGVDTSSKANKAATTKFTDVKAGKYYAAAIAWAYNNDIVSGKSDTTFEPETAITRQELAVMIVNFAKYNKIDLTAKEEKITFADNGSIAKWAKSAVVSCQKADIINGYIEGGKALFKPTESATRAEAVQMLYVFHKNFYLN